MQSKHSRSFVYIFLKLFCETVVAAPSIDGAPLIFSRTQAAFIRRYVKTFVNELIMMSHLILVLYRPISLGKCIVNPLV